MPDRRLIAEITSDYAFVFRLEADGSAVAEWVNESFARATGYTAEDIRALGGWLTMVHPDDAPLARAHARALLEGHPHVSEHRVVTRAGAVLWLRSSAQPVWDAAHERVIRIYGVAQDVTERRRGDEERRRLLAREQEARAEAESTRARFAFLAEASALLAASLDYETTLASIASLAVPRLGDWCIVDLVEADATLRRVAVAQADPGKQALARALEAEAPVVLGPPSRQAEVLESGRSAFFPHLSPLALARADVGPFRRRFLDVVRPVSAMIVPLRARGRTLGALSLITAESGRHYTRADLALAEDVARRAGLAVDNAMLYRAAQDADRRKEQFLATLGHELRTPLAAIAAAAWVLDRLGSPADAAARQREIIARQVRHLACLVDDLLDVARVRSGKVMLARRRLDLAGLVRRCVQLLAAGRPAGGPAITLAPAPGMVVVDGDAVRLEQVVSNLLDNAVKYTAPDGRVRVAVERRGREAVVSIEDTGIGIAREALATIFEPFAQVPGARERSRGGLGLGLALVRSLVEQHDGRVSAHSAGPGCGSVFTVTLPLVDAPPASAEEVAAPSAAIPRRILLVEDNPDARRAMKTILELWGHHVEVAEDGVRGVALAAATRPEVGIIDIGLPGLDGYQVARAVRAAPGGEGIYLVALTGYGQPEDERRAREAGFDAHLVKPPDPVHLSHLLAGAGERAGAAS
ncbi:MAG TPA: ATP-binding protein [Candidatus Binatia bacterium]|nr:ATP-binding protein [Candidatus Binatia bacterium]